MPQAPVISFPGISAVRSARIVRTHGTTPNSISIGIAPQASLIDRIGNLSIAYEGRILVIPDCIIDATSFQFDTRQRVISLIIFDRRWRWQFGDVNGHYNRRDDSGELVRAEGVSSKGTVIDADRTPQELATILLQSMGEQQFDVTNLPNDVNPEMQWEHANPAAELSELCDILDCRVVLGWDNRVRIHQLGTGALLPKTLPIIRTATSVDAKERPDRIDVACAPTVHQIDFLLEAVGEDVDGSIKTINRLSYTPDKNLTDGGWFRNFAFNRGFWFDDTDLKKIADKSIYRWYRIVIPFTFPATIERDDSPGGEDRTITEEFKVSLIDEVKPILPYLSETVIEDGRKVNRPPIIYGKWFDGDTFANSIATVTPLPRDVAEDDATVVPGGFSIDDNKGIVKFSRPIFAVDVVGRPIQATLRLRACFNFRQTHGSWISHVVSREQPDPRLGTKPLVVRRPELVFVRKTSYGESFKDATVSDNIESIEVVANSYIDAIENTFDTDLPTMAEYAGFFPFELDGNIRTVSFQFDATGIGGVTTTVQWNQDASPRGSMNYEVLRNHSRLAYISNRTRGRWAPDEKRRIKRESRG